MLHPITVAAHTTGRVQELLVDVGDRVEAGQTVARIDDRILAAELALARTRWRKAVREKERVARLAAARVAPLEERERAIMEVEVAAAQLELARQQLALTVVQSPIAGTVLEILARPGEAVTFESAGVIRLADLEDIAAEVDVAERALARVTPGQPVQVTSDLFPDQIFSGKVGKIMPEIDRARGMAKVRIDLDASSDSLLPGTSVKARFGAADTTASAP